MIRKVERDEIIRLDKMITAMRGTNYYYALYCSQSWYDFKKKRWFHSTTGGITPYLYGEFTLRKVKHDWWIYYEGVGDRNTPVRERWYLNKAVQAFFGVE